MGNGSLSSSRTPAENGEKEHNGSVACAADASPAVPAAPPMSPMSSEEGEVGVAPPTSGQLGELATVFSAAPAHTERPKEDRDVPPGSTPAPATADEILGGLDRVEQEMAALEAEKEDVEAELLRLTGTVPRLVEALTKVESISPVPPPIEHLSEDEPSDEAMSSDSEGEDRHNNKNLDNGNVLGGKRKRGRPPKNKKVLDMAQERGKALRSDDVAAERERIAAALELKKELPLPPAQRWLTRRLGFFVAGAAAGDVCDAILGQSKELGNAARSQFSSAVPDSLIAPGDGVEGGLPEPIPTGAPEKLAELLAAPLTASVAPAAVGIQLVLKRELRDVLVAHLNAAIEYRTRCNKWQKVQWDMQVRKATCTSDLNRAASTISAEQPTSPSVGRSGSRGRRDVVRSDLEERLAIATMQAIDTVKTMTDVCANHPSCT